MSCVFFHACVVCVLLNTEEDMVHLEAVVQRNADPEMHAASRVHGARGDVLIKKIVAARKKGKSSRRGLHAAKRKR